MLLQVELVLDKYTSQMDDNRRKDFQRLLSNNRLLVPSYKGAFRNFPKVLKLKFGKMPDEIKLASDSPNLRCLNCGWKYNFKFSTTCPLCRSDRSRLLEADDPFMNPINWLIAGFIAFALVRLCFYLFQNT